MQQALQQTITDCNILKVTELSSVILRQNSVSVTDIQTATCGIQQTLTSTDYMMQQNKQIATDCIVQQIQQQTQTASRLQN